MLTSLPAINLLRGARSGLPSGQTMTWALGEEGLTDAELQIDQDSETMNLLHRTGWLKKTPLWFYILQEGTARECKKGLGRIGSRLVARTIAGMLKGDPTSILGQGRGWKPPIWRSTGLQAKTMGALVGITLDLQRKPL